MNPNAVNQKDSARLSGQGRLLIGYVHTYWLFLLVADLLLQREIQPEKKHDSSADASTRVGHVFTKAEMESVWKDLEDMMTPSWLASVPKELGQPTHGKLKADQYRVLATTYLPVSLVRLWGLEENSSSPRAKRRREILDITLTLFSAVKVATALSTSRPKAERYLQLMRSYINGLKVLFPNYEFRPNHHMALHIYDCLLLFGPVHSWWTFPLERIIGMLQRIPTSGKFGELEETMAHSYIRSCNLRAIVSSSTCPEVVQKAAPFFNKLVNAEKRGTLITDILTFESTDSDVEMQDPDEDVLVDQVNGDDKWLAKMSMPIPPELVGPIQKYFGLFSPAVVEFRPLQHLSINNLNYSTFKKHPGNSSVLIHSTTESPLAAACIMEIFQIRDSLDHVHTLLGVRRRTPAPPNLSGPFQRHPALQMKLYGAAFGPLEVICPQFVSGHVAFLPLRVQRNEVVATISMSK